MIGSPDLKWLGLAWFGWGGGGLGVGGGGRGEENTGITYQPYT